MILKEKGRLGEWFELHEQGTPMSGYKHTVGFSLAAVKPERVDLLVELGSAGHAQDNWDVEWG